MILLVLTIVIPLAILIPQRLKIDAPIVITSDEDFLKYDFTGNGTKDNPFLIEDLEIINEQTRTSPLFSHPYGIYITNTSKHFIIQNCVIRKYDYGIAIGLVTNHTVKIHGNYFEESEYGGITCTLVNGLLIDNNEINGGSREGIYLIKCDNSILNNNTIYHTQVGIQLFDSHLITLNKNNCSFNSHSGVSAFLCNNTRIINNILASNQNDFSSVIGLELLVVYDSIICNNSITKNGYFGISTNQVYNSLFEFNNVSKNYIPNISHFGDGIFMEDSNNNTIRYNYFRENGAYGVRLFESHNNTIHHNAFILNDQNIQDQAFEENCTNNLWYESATLQGNFWQEWNASLVYEIGGGISVDLYPLEENPVSLYLALLLLKFIQKNK
ncbi:MAG: right-handed parallel beta-helix repeat-containing protein [Candidatus Heimdallarchaeaceae archaeon]